MESTILELEKSTSSMISPKEPHASSPLEALEKSIKQYLYFVYRRSIRDGELYENAASHMPDDERHTFLLEMAQRKREETAKLYSYYQGEGYRAIKNMKKRNIISMPHHQTEMALSRIVSIEDTYSFAFKKEQKNLELYVKLAGLDGNPYIKILFDYLSQLQMGHIVFIEKKVSQSNGSFLPTGETA